MLRLGNRGRETGAAKCGPALSNTGGPCAAQESSTGRLSSLAIPAHATLFPGRVPCHDAMVAISASATPSLLQTRATTRNPDATGSTRNIHRPRYSTLRFRRPLLTSAQDVFNLARQRLLGLCPRRCVIATHLGAAQPPRHRSVSQAQNPPEGVIPRFTSVIHRCMLHVWEMCGPYGSDAV
jgi:hypothetical protein